ncbi:MAG TPA: MarR family transcriptional regulator [Candidatus Ruania gallistercoris]|uniref:MarR family transcriptional regulator n=1 Tax=Candidatus Ruania gallistercoris TaxID=2838746 RepID=A0A9D2EC69_9MICO|nr:MarR family transcriptional regulator [Candidatus Ruania gallistercoris]
MSVSEPQWLSPEERTTWLALTGLLVRLPGALDSQLERDSGLSFFEYMVLAMLAEQENQTLRMSALAELTNGSLSRLSHVVRRLENEGLVRRETCQEDRRATNAILTANGRERVEAAAPGHVQHARELVVDAVAAEDLATFGRVAWQILDRLGGWQHT